MRFWTSPRKGTLPTSTHVRTSRVKLSLTASIMGVNPNEDILPQLRWEETSENPD
jgi:hypothetical protein